jgi:diguanylate cyclase (GGDEF)-like protein/PAS domain S-box-containing protein
VADIDAKWSEKELRTIFNNSIGSSALIESTHRHKNGKLINVEISTSNVELDGHHYYFATSRDISERKLAEKELQIAATAFEGQEGIIVTDAETRILRVNQAFTRLTGYSAEEAIGQTPAMLNSGRQDAEFYRAMWDTITHNQYWQGEMWNRRKNGEIYPEWLTITALADAQGRVTNYVGAFSDIAQHKKDEAEIHTLSFLDPLTGLPNRRLLRDRLQHTLASSTRRQNFGVILLIDLDDFQILNDSKGHDIGDQFLIEVAKRLQGCVREGDTVARLGGDEFVIMLEELSEDIQQAATQAEAVGKKILTSINQSYSLRDGEHHSTTSIGITLFNNDHESIDELLKQADIALYQAKKAGRNTLRFFDEHMQTAINSRIESEGALHNALQNREFQLYYQIQIDESNGPIGAEALIRWVHPKHGLVSPAEFIPLAEETGLILPIGQWVLDTACAQIKAWERDTLTCELLLAVNVSGLQFMQTDFITSVQTSVQKYGIKPRLLKLELTESMLMGNIDETISKMNALNAIGIQFSLDDFGTGYSSMQYLKRLPLDQIKIDQSFVRDLETDSHDRAIVRTIIAMAQSLKLDVIAEGVETIEQQQLLIKKGCTQFQGYLFGKPLPIDQFEELLKNDSKTSTSKFVIESVLNVLS